MSDQQVSYVQFPPGAGVVILDRIEPDIVPEYCCHGRAPCIRCQEWCWLGHKTRDVVAEARAMPLCKQCAHEVIPPGTKATEHVEDHRRADGPHE